MFYKFFRMYLQGWRYNYSRRCWVKRVRYSLSKLANLSNMLHTENDKPWLGWDKHKAFLLKFDAIRNSDSGLWDITLYVCNSPDPITIPMEGSKTKSFEVYSDSSFDLL